MKTPLRVLLAALFLAVVAAPCAQGQPRLVTATVAAGGGTINGGTTSMVLTVGQAAIGSSNGSSFDLGFGFPAQVLAEGSMPTAIEPGTAGDEVPADYFLDQNHPNPFNPTTVIRYALPQAAPVTVAIYDVLGRHLETLVDDVQRAGTHEVRWEAGGFPSGVYLYVLRANGFVEMRRMVLLK